MVCIFSMCITCRLSQIVFHLQVGRQMQTALQFSAHQCGNEIRAA